MSGLERLKSRFFVDTDERMDHLLYDLPKTWWSRPYEYAWCASFATEQSVVLDAACGIGHPFKFFLGERCKSTFACDADPRIESFPDILEDIRQNVGEAAAAAAAAQIRPDTVAYARANLVALPYQDASFDLIFCISVLEHLSPADCAQSLREFSRTLKASGRLVLTFDYPTVNLEALERQLEEAGLAFSAEVDYVLPDHAVHSTLWGDLYVFRAVLQKKV